MTVMNGRGTAVTPHLDKLEDLLGSITGLTDIIQKDLCHKDSDSDSEAPTLSHHHIGCLLSAIDELAKRGYCALDAIDKAAQEWGALQ